tara:strand:- start:3387 stop:4064 length:678 start_codon:yes stop_codon:yes gene_type:complete
MVETPPLMQEEQVVEDMITSERGVQLLKNLETGDGNPILKAYKDGNSYSIGYGHHTTSFTEFDFDKDTEITAEQAEELLFNDLAVVEKEVNKLFSRVNINQNEFDAIVIAYYNRPVAVKRSGLVNAIASGSEEEIEDAWYNSIPEKAPRGLRSQRVPAELDWFFTEAEQEQVDMQPIEDAPLLEEDRNAMLGEEVSTEDAEIQQVMATHMMDIINSKRGADVASE